MEFSLTPPPPLYDKALSANLQWPWSLESSYAPSLPLSLLFFLSTFSNKKCPSPQLRSSSLAYQCSHFFFPSYHRIIRRIYASFTLYMCATNSYYNLCRQQLLFSHALASWIIPALMVHSPFDRTKSLHFYFFLFCCLIICKGNEFACSSKDQKALAAKSLGDICASF